MLVESTRIRDLLNTTMLVSTLRPKIQLSDQEAKSAWNPPKSYSISMNPFPGLIILLLGLMMSSHHQTSMLSTMIHKQWGMLLVGAALARAVTYIVFYISPPTSILPSRPPSELITSFCLISGGLIFMASVSLFYFFPRHNQCHFPETNSYQSRDTVTAMEKYDLNPMFAFTVVMGLTAFLMSWTTIVIAIKGWALRGANRLPKSHLAA